MLGAIEQKPGGGMLLIGSILIVASFFVPQILVGVLILCALALVWLLSKHLLFGWYVLVALSPLIMWQWSLAPLRPWLAEYPWIYHMQAPAVEFWAIVLCAAFGLSLARRFIDGERIVLRLPGLWWFLLFVLSALLSLYSELAVERLAGLKYIAHFILLFYVGYIVLGSNIVESKAAWRQSLRILAGAGLVGAALGALSVLANIFLGEGLTRAAPLPLLGFAPFGQTHILLAEVLTTTLPIWLYFWSEGRNTAQARLLALASGFIFLVGLLTLSRAAWVTLAFEGAIFFYLTRARRAFWHLVKEWWWALLLASPVLVYFVYFLFTSAAASGSTAARLSLSDVALYLWRQHPLIGQGAGTFVARLGEIRVFSLEFGEPLDAHGVVQKLLSEQGIFGLAAFGLFIGWIILVILRHYRDTNYTDEARTAYFVSFFLVLSPLIFQLFNTQYYSSKMWVPISLALIQTMLYHGDTHIVRLTLNFIFKRRRVITGA